MTYQESNEGLMLRARIRDLAEEWNDEAAYWLAGRDDVSISEIHRDLGTDNHYIVYRFDLPTGADIDWDPEDGWDGPGHVIDHMYQWVRMLEDERDKAKAPPVWNYSLDGYEPQEGDWWLWRNGARGMVASGQISVWQSHRVLPVECIAYYRPPGPPPVPEEME